MFWPLTRIKSTWSKSNLSLTVGCLSLIMFPLYRGTHQHLMASFIGPGIVPISGTAELTMMSLETRSVTSSSRACYFFEIHPCDRRVHPGTGTAWWPQRTINFIFKRCRSCDVRVVDDGGKRKTFNWFWCKRSPFTYLLMEVKVKSQL